jgi:hypothetical protein
MRYLNTSPPVHNPDKLKPQQLGQESVDPPIQVLREGPYRQEQDGLQCFCKHRNRSRTNSFFFCGKDQERIRDQYPL